LYYSPVYSPVFTGVFYRGNFKAVKIMVIAGAFGVQIRVEVIDS
jgi:hypothetical protein